MEWEQFQHFLGSALKIGASDIHLKVGSPPVYRIQKELRTVKGDKLTPQDTRDVVGYVLRSVAQVGNIEEIRDFDTSFSLPGKSRFRVNIYRQRGTFALAIRAIPNDIPTFETLLLPPQVEELATYQRGLVLVTGATGSGKSSTLAAIVNHINRTRAAHVVTIEDPIEFLHKDIRAAVSQREVGTDTNNFKRALKAALRQDPDVILVGEMRDLETIDIALKAAETGHMVYSTAHTTDAIKTVGRIIAVFPSEEQDMVRVRLAENLRATLSQRLLPRADSTGMVVALELMKVTSTVEEMIRNREDASVLKDIIERSREQYGMMSFDQHLMELYKNKLITFEVAKRNATSPNDFERALHFE
jgi:twitching motility protein PilT